MTFTQQQKDEIFRQYMAWVGKVSDDLEDKSYFYPKEIVIKVLEIVEQMGNTN